MIVHHPSLRLAWAVHRMPSSTEAVSSRLATEVAPLETGFRVSLRSCGDEAMWGTGARVIVPRI